MATNRRGARSGSPHAGGKILLILDMNGVLFLRTGSDKRGVQLRSHIDVFLSKLDELSDRLIVGVWSSMMEHNLRPAVYKVFGQERADNLAFILDQKWCTERWVKGMHKPLLRKDLVWLKQTEYWRFVPDQVLLIDDDPIKCTENPPGTALHPSSFTGQIDDELWALSEYLENLAYSWDLGEYTSVREYVLANPYAHCEADAAASDEEVWQEQELRNEENAWESQEEIEQPPAKRARNDAQAGPGRCILFPGKRVEAYWPDDDTWIAAKVVSTPPRGSAGGEVEIIWEADGSASTVPLDYVRNRSKQVW